jgi:ADP-ribose pyrophosphatase YjhB (NUDIX family)
MSETQIPPYVRVAAYALCADDEERILLVRISPGYAAVGMWTLPGGGLNFGEHPEAGAVRELEEETGLQGEVVRLAFVDSYTRESIPEEGYGPFQSIQIVYDVRITGGTLRDERDESTDMAAWFTPREAHDLRLVGLAVRALGHLEASEVALAD